MTRSERGRRSGGGRALAAAVLAIVVAMVTLVAFDLVQQQSQPDLPDPSRPSGPATSSPPEASPPAPSPSTSPGTSNTPEPPDQGPPTLLVGTLNALGAGHDSERGWRQRTGALVRLLHKYGLGARGGRLSLIGLQETTPRQLRVLRQHLARHDMRVAVIASGWDRAIIADSRTWQVRRRGTLPLPYGPGATRPNPAAILEHRTSGRTVAVASVHLPALPRLKQPALMRSRRAAGLDLIARRADQWHDRGHAVLVLGDFNQRQVPRTVARSLRTGWGADETPVIDWVLGSRDEWRWLQTRIDPRTRRLGISDHRLVLQHLRLP